MPTLSLRKLWRRRSASISQRDPCYKVVYLGNTLTTWAKGDGCLDKPLATLWKSYCHSTRPEIIMKVTITNSGLQAVTREHGLTEYWAHRVTHCGSHPAYPRLFCWVYRHEGRRLKPELRCHAVVCPRASAAQTMATQLRERLRLALHEFRREKVNRQNARLSVVTAIYDAFPTRKVLLSTGATNYRPPLERSKSAPKLSSIIEAVEAEAAAEREDDRLLQRSPGCTFERHVTNISVYPQQMSHQAQVLQLISVYEDEGNGQSKSCEAVSMFENSVSSSEINASSGLNGSSGHIYLDLPMKNHTGPSRSIAEVSEETNGSIQSENLQASQNVSSTLITNQSSPCSRFSSTKCYSSDIRTNTNDNVSAVSRRSVAAAPQSRNRSLHKRFLRSMSVDTSLETSSDDNVFDEQEVIRNNTNTNIEMSLLARICPQEFEQFDEEGVSMTSTSTGETVLDCETGLTQETIPSQDMMVDKKNGYEKDYDMIIDRKNGYDQDLARSLASLSLSPRIRPGESLTSDQPESLGSHSCSSSCDECSASGVEISSELIARASYVILTSSTEDIRVVGGFEKEPSDLLSDDCRKGRLTETAEEPDNISEESGYAEEKDFADSGKAGLAI